MGEDGRAIALDMLVEPEVLAAKRLRYFFRRGGESLVVHIQCSATFSYALFTNGSVACAARCLASSAFFRQVSLSDDIRGGSQMHRTRRQVRRWPMVMIRHPLPYGARKRASYVEGCAAARGDSASRFRPPNAPQPDEQ